MEHQKYGSQWAEHTYARALLFFLRNPPKHREYTPMNVWECMTGSSFEYCGAMYSSTDAMRRDFLIVCTQLTTVQSARYFEKWSVWIFLDYFSPKQQATILSLLQKEVQS